ncbi:hypothetical protein C8J56DRAFT_905632 [Mycena floridula]|nr:hypothetical protein C8J56DRAFT_905632 [Mycena floridula]
MQLYYFEQLPFNESAAVTGFYAIMFNNDAPIGHAFSDHAIALCRTRTCWNAELAHFHLFFRTYKAHNTTHFSTIPYNDPYVSDDELPPLVSTWDSDSDSGYVTGGLPVGTSLADESAAGCTGGYG